jgi:hypothetical protein
MLPRSKGNIETRMKAMLWGPICGALVAASCTQSAATHDSALIDEGITLERRAQMDVATREVTVDSPAVLVAIVDENLTDVRVRMAVAGNAAPAVEVENNLEGAGTEIAVLEVPRGARVSVTLTGPANGARPGTVHLRLRQMAAKNENPAIAALLDGYRAWSDATAATLRKDDIANALPTIDRAIASFQESAVEHALAAEALRVKANMYFYFGLDMPKAYEIATQAVAAHQTSGNAPALARAELLQAFTLAELAADPQSKHPPAADANILARDLFGRLSEDAKRLGRLERAAAMTALAVMDRNDGRADWATYRFDEARTMYESVGHASADLAGRTADPCLRARILRPGPPFNRCRAP